MTVSKRTKWAAGGLSLIIATAVGLQYDFENSQEPERKHSYTDRTGKAIAEMLTSTSPMKGYVEGVAVMVEDSDMPAAYFEGLSDRLALDNKLQTCLKTDWAPVSGVKHLLPAAHPSASYKQVVVYEGERFRNWVYADTCENFRMN